MTGKRQLLFNHIPKTGGVTLRIILNRVYGENNVFMIRSTDIASSLELFNNLSKEERNRYAVVAGHGAELFLPFMNDPFRITILRKPLALFLSQYHYLKNTPDAGFYDDVSRLDTIDEYLEFAIEKGQDNLLTRYLSGAIEFLADPSVPVPDMQKDGDRLLEQAKNALREYDAVIDLAAFDADIYALASILGWRRIPLYRPANRNRKNPGMTALTESFTNRLKEVLKYDIVLYDEFKRAGIAAGNQIERPSFGLKMFLIRQKGVYHLSKILRLLGLSPG